VFACYITVAAVCIYNLEHNYETTQLILYLSLYMNLILFLLLILISLTVFSCFFPLLCLPPLKLFFKLVVFLTFAFISLFSLIVSF
jgi:hypothetical protein